MPLKPTTNNPLEPILPKLYRRGKNFVNRPAEVMIGQGPNQAQELNIDFPTPGWIAVDIAADVAHTNDGEVPLGIVEIYVDDVLRESLRGSYTWTRLYIYVDAGRRNVVFRTNEYYKPQDRAWLRRINATEFREIKSIDTIYKCPPPNPLRDLKRFPIINGYDRYQQSGPGGADIDMELVISNKNGKSAAENYRDFISGFSNFYILRYQNGLYGGLLIDPDIKWHGPIIQMKVKFTTPMDAGLMIAKAPEDNIPKSERGG